MRKSFFVLFFAPLLSFCGSNPTLQLNLTGATAFGDSNVKDIVFIIANVPGTGGGLDQNGDGTPDTFIYPTTCGAAKAAGCGFAPTSGEITIGDLPLNFTYKVSVQLRGSTGTVLHSGTAQFNNVENAPVVTIAVN